MEYRLSPAPLNRLLLLSCLLLSGCGVAANQLSAPQSQAVRINAITSTGDEGPATLAPVIQGVAPNEILGRTRVVTVTGKNFLTSSQVRVDGNQVRFTLLDSEHMFVPVIPATVEGKMETISISNLNSSGADSASISLPQRLFALAVNPLILTGGQVSFGLVGTGFSNKTAVTVGGRVFQVDARSTNSVQVSGYLPPWVTGQVSIAIFQDDPATPVANLTASIAATPVTYDAAARFATQAGFGPRHDVVEHIQQVGFEEYLQEQFAQPALTFTPGKSERTLYIQQAISGQSLLRQRVSFALRTFIPTMTFDSQNFALPFELLLENNAFGNVRTLLEAITSDTSMANFLDLAGNAAPADPTLHPNQNYARELLQLFSIGPFLLNEDGTTKIDQSGNPIASYDQDTILDLSRALTGWNNAPATNPDFNYFGIDPSKQVVASEADHDHLQKVLFGNITLPAGQSITQDRTAALDAIFQHPNVPPYFSKILIQRLVTSNPSPEYISRVVAVFKNDGTDTRGNLKAVIRAILLDPEARLGDETAGAALDGHLQEPLLAQTFAGSVLENLGSDGQIEYYPGILGDNLWGPPNVFGAYSANFQIPGTTLNGPEFQVYDNQLLVQRAEFLWGQVSFGIAGYTDPSSSWIMTQFNNVPDLVEALDHLVYHGQMPDKEKASILNYSNPLMASDLDAAKRSAIFLALSSDNFIVSH